MEEDRQEWLDRIQELDAEIERLQLWAKCPEFAPMRYGADGYYFRQELEAKRALRLRLIQGTSNDAADDEWIDQVRDCARDLALRVHPHLDRTVVFTQLFNLSGARDAEDFERWRRCFKDSGMIPAGPRSRDKYRIFARRVRRLVAMVSDKSG